MFLKDFGIQTSRGMIRLFSVVDLLFLISPYLVFLILFLAFLKWGVVFAVSFAIAGGLFLRLLNPYRKLPVMAFIVFILVRLNSLISLLWTGKPGPFPLETLFPGLEDLETEQHETDLENPPVNSPTDRGAK